MQVNRKRVIPLVAVSVGALILLLLLRPGSESGAESQLSVKVRRDTFKLVVQTAGELRAKQHTEVKGPPDAQSAQIYTMKIQSMVPEGTIVKEGDTIAELDRAAIAIKMTEVNLTLTKATAALEQAQLDTTLNLATARENSRNLRIALEEKTIARDQAKYEAPGVQRLAQMEYEKAERALKQDSSTYETKVKQAQAKMREMSIDVTRQQNLMAKVVGVQDQFTIRASSKGMINYVREYNGKKRQAGSTLNSYDPIIAQLPDLTLMQSVTFVNELDVRKLSVGLPVIVSLDSDPGKKLKAIVSEVANMGEQRPNVDAKVFEVVITMEVSDTSLRPGMTSSNAIEAINVPNALLIPLESVFSQGDVPFVFKKAGGKLIRQEIRTGHLNDADIVVVRGLDEGDEVLLTMPANSAELTTVMLDPAAATSGGDSANRKTLTPPGAGGATSGESPVQKAAPTGSGTAPVQNPPAPPRPGGSE